MTDSNTKQTIFLNAYKSCHEPFVRYCSALTYGKMDTEDLVQDVLLSAYQHFETINDKNQFLHYLIRAARNRSISHWRRQKYKAELLDKHADRLMAQEVDSETLVDIQFLYQTMDRLPTKQKDALILFEISGFSMKEIAVIQQSTEGAIKTKISRGRQRLRKLLIDRSNTVENIFGTLKTISL